MQLLIPLAGLLGIEIDVLKHQVKAALVVNTILGLLVLLGTSLLLLAGLLALAEVVGIVYAALAMAGASLLLALAIYVVTQIFAGKRQRELVEKRRSSETGAFLTTAAITAIPVLLRSPLVRSLGLPAAAIAAFVLLHKSDDKD